MYTNSSDFSNFRIGGGATATALSPMLLVLTLLAIVLIFMLPRRWVVLPLIILWIIAPFGQQVYVGGLHLFIDRILTLFGWIRVATMNRPPKTKVFAGGFGLIDKIFVSWALCRFIATCLLFLQVQALINQCGFLIETIAAYFLLRVLVRDELDIERVLKSLVWVASIVAAGMAIESLRGYNLFGYLGGSTIPFEREGRIRARGPFLGPISAGTFGATILCMCVSLWRSGKSILTGILGTMCSAVIVITSASSTPLLALAAASLGICMWPVRRHMYIVRWGFVIFLIALQLVMKSPVWWAINHIDLVGGNSAYHRAMIVDQCIMHFADWWLFGIKSTADWGWDMWDGANQFVAESESGGLATLVLFLLLVSRTFGQIGIARRTVRGYMKSEWFFWLIGCMLFSFVVSFFGISFSDQSINGWIAFLAITAIATTSPATCVGHLKGVHNTQRHSDTASILDTTPIPNKFLAS
jgi:hypothetical protein